jgi:hypothetical protein
MEFRLVYQGRLVSSGSVLEKQTLRRVLHPQLKALWHQPPLDDARLVYGDQLYQREGVFKFAPLVSSKRKLVAELDILFLRPQRPGDLLLHHGGDIDNRLKTLLDSPRIPRARQNEIPQGDSPLPDEEPF